MAWSAVRRTWAYLAIPLVAAAGSVVAAAPVTAAAPPAIVMTVGWNHGCALRSSLSAGPVCWGENSEGQLGNGTTTASLTPVAVDTSGALNGVTLTKIAGGGAHTCGLSSAGRAY